MRGATAQLRAKMLMMSNLKPRPEWIPTGLRLEELQGALGKSGGAMAAELEINRQNWSRYKLGIRELPIWVAVELKNRYGVGLDWLYVGDLDANKSHFNEKLAALKTKPKRAISIPPNHQSKLSRGR
jgi:hypothetical protein